MRLIQNKARRHIAALLSTVRAATALVALTAAAPASLAATPSSAAITGKLVVWDFNEDTPQGKSYPTVDAAFEKMYPGVTIEHVAKPATTYGAVVQAAMAAKAVPGCTDVADTLCDRAVLSGADPTERHDNAGLAETTGGMGRHEPQPQPQRHDLWPSI